MTCTRAGVGADGCNPIPNEQRIAWWRDRLRAWVGKQPDPDAEDLALGRKAAAGLKFQKALRKRKRVSLRPPKPRKPSNVFPLPTRRRA